MIDNDGGGASDTDDLDSGDLGGERDEGGADGILHPRVDLQVKKSGILRQVGERHDGGERAEDGEKVVERKCVLRVGRVGRFGDDDLGKMSSTAGEDEEEEEGSRQRLQSRD